MCVPISPKDFALFRIPHADFAADVATVEELRTSWTSLEYLKPGKSGFGKTMTFSLPFKAALVACPMAIHF